MGDALVVANVPEEAFMLEGLCDYANGKTVRLADLYRNERKLFRFGKGRAELLRRHPNAFYQLPIRRNEIWEPPEEPTKSTVTAGTKTVTPAGSTRPPYGRAWSDS